MESVDEPARAPVSRRAGAVLVAAVVVNALVLAPVVGSVRFTGAGGSAPNVYAPDMPTEPPALRLPPAGTVTPSPRLVPETVPKAPSLSGLDLSERFRGYLEERPGQVGVAVYDALTGRTITVDDPTVSGFETASTVKLSILLGILERAGPSGRLGAGELRSARAMIGVSDNAAASRLWRSLGGAAPMDAMFRRLGMTRTKAGGGGRWGLTLTSAVDQLAVLRTLAYPGGVLGDQARATATSLLAGVVPAQRWGLPGGVPAGVAVEVKNGWLPRDSGWVIASLGHVHGGGRDYVMAVYSRGNPSMRAGIDTVEGLSRIAWDAAVAPVAVAARIR
ncbi:MULTISPECIES: serine hydrolase [unclassified Frankia]|uniref:serine hydrolase n=1 Tax=unclassified Frankia TaxID=2632575 RepID=UPI002024C866